MQQALFGETKKNKHTFQWIFFFCNGIKHINSDYKYNLLWVILFPNMVRHVAGKKLIVLILCIICTLNFWAEKSGKIVHLIYIIAVSCRLCTKSLFVNNDNIYVSQLSYYFYPCQLQYDKQVIF